MVDLLDEYISAIKSGDEEEIKKLLGNAVNANVTNLEGKTPMHLATEKGNMDYFKN